MPKPANPKRNAQIVRYRERDWTYQRIADKVGCSTAWVNVVLANARKAARQTARRRRKAA
jgi:DNA-directed RNA polymerase specialized sigma24 family protein